MDVKETTVFWYHVKDDWVYRFCSSFQTWMMIISKSSFFDEDQKGKGASSSGITTWCPLRLMRTIASHSKQSGKANWSDVLLKQHIVHDEAVTKGTFLQLENIRVRQCLWWVAFTTWIHRELGEQGRAGPQQSWFCPQSPQVLVGLSWILPS